jgi:N-acetylglucosamine repressor
VKRIVGNQKLARITNQRLIIDVLREKGSVSRTDLARMLHLSVPTVSWNTSQLIEQGFVIETGTGESSGGRKPIMLEFDYSFGTILGIDLSGETIKVALSNLKPEIYDEESFEIPDIPYDRKLLEWIIKKMDSVLDRNPSSRDRLKVISIGFPGVVDGISGQIIASSRFGEWIGLDLKKIIADRYKASLLINNDINTAVSGELMFGCGNGYRNLVYIGVDVGIGAGLVLNGSLFEGSGNNAGELSKIILTPFIPNQKDHQEIYLESIVSVTKMVSDFKEQVRAQPDLSMAVGFAGGDTEQIDLDHIAKALQHKDPFCTGWIKSYAEILGIVIANIVNLLDVEAVIIGNEISKLGTLYIEAVRDTVYNHVNTKPRILYSQLGTKTVLYGTFAIALEHVVRYLVR